jgi:hypothetical protein
METTHSTMMNELIRAAATTIQNSEDLNRTC